MPDAEMIPDLDVESGTRPAPGLPVQRGALFFALSAIAFGTAWLAAGSTRISVLFLVGDALGASLLATGFGFTSGYRRAILRRDVAHVQAQLLMLGWPGALALQLTVLVALATIVTHWSRGAKRGQPESLSETITTTIEPTKGTILGWISRHRVLAFGAVSLATLNLVTLLVAGHPWTITWAFGLWGAKTAAAAGWNPAGSSWPPSSPG